MQWSNVDWPVVMAIGSMHVFALLAFHPAFFSWSAVAVMVLLCWASGGLGVTLGFHRLLTHGSFQTPRLIKYLLTAIGCTTLQGSPVQWVGTHRLHHAESDTDHDPHTPRHGFTWAHMLWCMTRNPNGHVARDAAKDLLRDRVMAWLDRNYLLPALVLGVLLYLLGGWSWVIWGMCVRTVIVYHGTWFVNSAAHTWGYRNFNTTDGSRNTWWVAILSFGEGWHNNHHAHQRSAAHGLKWWEFDITYLTILAMEKVGLAWRVVKPTPDMRVGDK